MQINIDFVLSTNSFNAIINNFIFSNTSKLYLFWMYQREMYS